MSAATGRPTRPAAPPLTPAVLGASLAFLLWMWGGYVVLLLTLGHLPMGTAAWQALLCLLAMPVLLSIVVQFIALPKPFMKLLRRPPVEAVWVYGKVVEVLFPWLGWATLLWLLHGGRWAVALLPAGGIAVFSYLTGIAILLLFHPRARSVRLTQLEVPIPGLPAAFDGYRILHLSDLHTRAYLSPDQARARMAVAQGMEADLVVFTGDLTDDSRMLLASAEALAALAARDGAVSVMGNHDHWLGASRVVEALRQQGITPLMNAHLSYHRGEGVLHVVGVDNSAYHARDDLEAAFEGVGEGETVVLLSHAPDILERPLASRASVILCGHTHGGQVVLPLYGPFHVPSKVGRHYPSGLFRLDRGWLYVNRGLGEISPPLRVLCPPEVAVITLRCASPN